MTVRRFFADTHPVNQIATPLADQTGWTTQMAAAGPLQLRLAQYSVPIYETRLESYLARWTQLPWAMAMYRFLPTNKPAFLGRWEDAWWPPDGVGNDRTVITIDPATGNTVEYWMVDWKWRIVLFGSTIAKSAQKCAAIIRTYPDIYGRTHDRNRIGLRGCGLDKAAAIIRIDELEDGHLGHALEMTVPTTRITAAYREPATRGEIATLAHGQAGGVITRVRPDSETMLSGSRWQLAWTADEIDAHLDKFFTPTALGREVTMTILFAARVRGAIAMETSGETTGNIGVETDWCRANAARYAALGITTAADNPVQRCLAAIPPSAWKLCEETR